MKEISIFKLIGNKDFAENKDVGQQIRLEEIMPELEKDREVILNFEKIDRASQSFIHSLISEPVRKYGADKSLDLMLFKSCNKTVKAMINIVLDYLQDALQDEEKNH
jgi:hypothetical protein